MLFDTQLARRHGGAAFLLVLVEVIGAVSSHRQVIALPYAQDDDGAYAGRPYTPPAGFASWLEQSGCSGYGILHWTTRPLDIYLKSLSVQVWKSTRDQRLQETCEQMAERTFGRAGGAAGARYLQRWITEAPLFGRDTTDRFIDRTLPDRARRHSLAGLQTCRI